MRTATKSNIGEWLLEARQLLTSAGDRPGLEAQVLLEHILEQPRAWVIAHPEALLSNSQQESLAALLAQRLQGTPLPYLLGHWEFYGLDFIVNENVLIPRPETEFLVEEALDWLRGRRPPLLVADVGTGSGCIAVSLACHAPAVTVLATDISRPALTLAQQNVLRHAVSGRVHLVQANLLEAFAGPLDLVCANLPYIPTTSLNGLDVARREPRLALDGGPDGLRLIERLIEQAPERIAPGGLMALEMQFDQGEWIAALCRETFPGAEVRVERDLAGFDRIVTTQLP